ncbi:MAG: oxidase [Gammaproteobacteria bacterium]|nr:oxidase [Gammaproteobacteria bacterium]
MNTTSDHSSIGVLGIWITLIVLAALSIAAAYLPIGSWTWIITYPIAAMMALLIMASYMRLRSSTVIVRIFAGAGFFWLLLWFAVTLTDYLTRPHLYLT